MSLVSSVHLPIPEFLRDGGGDGGMVESSARAGVLRKVQ